MDADEDFEVDPALAAAMGFSGFGSQTNKKRKFDGNDGFVDPTIGRASAATATGANSTPTGQQHSIRAKSTATTIAEDQGKTARPTPATGSVRSPEALRHGVKNERGDMVYFLPSFIEDPWKGLKPQ